MPGQCRRPSSAWSLCWDCASDEERLAGARVIYDPETRTAHWKGEDVPLRSEASFRVERQAMRNLVKEGCEWLEVRGRDSRRRVHITMARRMATVQGLHVLIPWRCWERIEIERPSKVENGLTEEILAARTQKARASSAQKREDAGQQRLV
jgi:hypothetical protein